MSDEYTPQTAHEDCVTLDNKTYDDLLEAAQENTRKTISRSEDSIVLKADVKRGSGTRDQDKINVKIKGSNPDETAEKLADTLDALEKHGVADTLRETQPGESDE